MAPHYLSYREFLLRKNDGCRYFYNYYCAIQLEYSCGVTWSHVRSRVHSHFQGRKSTMSLVEQNGVYSVDELIQYYHHVCPRLKYHEIQRIINEYHNMEMSLSTLKRRLRELFLVKEFKICFWQEYMKPHIKTHVMCPDNSTRTKPHQLHPLPFRCKIIKRLHFVFEEGLTLK